MSEQDQQTAQQAAELEAMANAATDDEGITGDWQPGEDKREKPNQKTEDILAPIIYMAFNGIANKRGSHWSVSADEATESARGFAAAIDEYWPSFNAAPWMMAAGAGIGLFLPPILGEIEIAQRKKNAEQQNTATETGGNDADKSE